MPDYPSHLRAIANDNEVENARLRKYIRELEADLDKANGELSEAHLRVQGLGERVRILENKLKERNNYAN